jgi:2-hydroxychromene-2-carboxylate isomerase
MKEKPYSIKKQPAASESIEFWFDFGSPYSFLSATRISAQRKESVLWKPFLLTRVFDHVGWDGALSQSSPDKKKYVWRDVERTCNKFGFAFKKPSRFPRLGEAATAIGAYAIGKDWQPLFCRDVFQLNFQHDIDIDSSLIIRELLDKHYVQDDFCYEILNSPSLVALINRSEIETALERTVFGSPTFFSNGEMFWGNDRLNDAFR